MKPYKLPRWFFLVFLTVIFLLIGGGTWFFLAERDLLQKNTENELLTITQGKVDQISAWRRNQIEEANELTSSQFFIEGVADWQTSGNPENEQMILARLKSLQDHYGYFDALLVNPQGQPLLGLNKDLTPLDSGTISTLNNALTSGESLLTDLHLNEKIQIPQISVVAPLIMRSAGKPTAIGAVVLISDARNYLYPLIQSWPTASATAETLLVERDGENVLYLNELRHQKDTAFKLRISLTETQLPAVKAVLGESGVFTGNDYRGVEVLSALMPVPDSPWFMVAKVDASEALAVWRTSAALIIALMLGFIGTAVGMALVLWQRAEKSHYFNLAAAKASHRESEERHLVTLMSVGDGVIVTDKDGKIQLINPVAEALTGWSQAEAKGKALGKVFHIINEETQKVIESPVAKVIREGLVVGLANHTLLVARDGSRRPIADSGAPIRNEKGDVNGIVLVFRDQSEERAALQELVESEKKFRIYFESTPIAITLYNNEGTYLMVNPAYCDMLGYSQEEIVGKKVSDFTHPGDLDAYSNRLQRMLSGEKSSYNVEKRILRKDGSAIWVEGNTNLIRDEAGKPQFFLSNMTNITDRKQMEDKLRESEEKFRRYFEETAVGISLTETNGQMKNVNKTLCDMLGYSREELTAKGFAEITHPDDVAESKEALSGLLAGEKPAYRFEKRFIKKDGSILWVDLSTTLLRDAEGKPLHLITSVVDITDRKSAEKQLVESEQKFRLYFESSASSISLIQPDGKYIMVNPAFCDMLGYTREEIVTRKYSDFTHPDDLDKNFDRISRMLSGEISSVSVEKRIVRKDGNPVWVRGNTSLVRDEEGKPQFFLANMVNITERKHAEEEILKLNAELEQRVIQRTRELKEAQEKILRQERLTVLGQLAGGVSHELRNPLGVISNSIYYLGKLLPQADEKTTEYLGIIAGETRRAEKIITDLLDYSRVKSPEREPVDINDLVVKTLKRFSPPGNISVEITMPEFHPKVLADAIQIGQVLGNLIQNACQAMPDGGTLSLSGDIRKIKNDSFFTIAVKDTGAGISSKNMKHLFEPLYTTKQRGIGLGLAICKNLIEGNGGWIEASSQAGKGSQFTFGLLIASEPSIKGKNDHKKETSD